MDVQTGSAIASWSRLRRLVHRAVGGVAWDMPAHPGYDDRTIPLRRTLNVCYKQELTLSKVLLNGRKVPHHAIGTVEAVQ